MGLFRLIIFGFIIYFGSKLVKAIFNQPANKNKVNGNPHHADPIDLSDADIEDVEFEEIDED